MTTNELRTLAEDLRRKGLDARSLGAEGIMIWKAGRGFFFPAWSIEKCGARPDPRVFEASLNERNGNVCQLG